MGLDTDQNANDFHQVQHLFKRKLLRLLNASGQFPECRNDWGQLCPSLWWFLGES